MICVRMVGSHGTCLVMWHVGCIRMVGIGICMGIQVRGSGTGICLFLFEHCVLHEVHESFLEFGGMSD